MAVENLYADAVLANSSLTAPENALGEPDGVFTTNADQTNWNCRFSLGDPVDVLTGTQNVDLVVRRSAAGGNDPTVQIDLYENGALVANLIPSQTVIGDASVILSGTFDASVITNKTDVEVLITATGSTGPTQNRRNVQIDGIAWKANTEPPPPPEGSITQTTPAFAQVLTGTVEIPPVQYLDTTPTPGATHTYRVRAVDGEWSDPIDVTVPADSAVSGSIAQTAPGFQNTLSASVTVAGDVAHAVPSPSQSMAAEVRVEGSASSTVPGFGQALSAEVTVEASAAQTVPGFEQTANANLKVSGAISQTVPGFSQSLSGQVGEENNGTISQTVPGFEQTLGADVGTGGPIAQTVPGFSQALSADLTVTGSLAQTVTGFAASGTAEITVHGAVDQTVPGFSQSITAEHGDDIGGTIAQTVPGFSQALTAEVGTGGPVAQTVPGFDQTITVALTVLGDVAQTAPVFDQTISANVAQAVEGSIAQTVPGFEQALTGTVPLPEGADATLSVGDVRVHDPLTVADMQGRWATADMQVRHDSGEIERRPPVAALDCAVIDPLTLAEVETRWTISRAMLRYDVADVLIDR